MKRKKGDTGLSDSGGASDDSSMASNQAKEMKKKARLANRASESLSAIGSSQSATALRNLREKVKNGEFIPKPKNLARWKEKLIKLDANLSS